MISSIDRSICSVVIAFTPPDCSTCISRGTNETSNFKNNDRLAEIAAEFVRLNVDVIVTWGTASVLAAKQATSVIPIVFASAGDPVGTGLVARLARPGGNVTGSSNQAADVAGKRLELLRESIPGLRHLAILANISSPIGE